MRERNTLVGVGLFVGVGLLCGFFTALFDSTAGEVGVALGSVVGGIIGALGAAAAVYITLTAQRDEEASKITTAITTEIAQLAKFPREQLETCIGISRGTIQVARNKLALLMQTPQPTLYLSAAERISRVPRPTLVISFYLGLAEVESTVRVILTAPGDAILRAQDVVGLGVLLMSQCYLARQILAHAPIPTGKDEELFAAMRRTIISGLDETIERGRQVFPGTHEYEEATALS